MADVIEQNKPKPRMKTEQKKKGKTDHETAQQENT